MRTELFRFLGLAVTLEQTTCLAALVKGFLSSSTCPGVWESRDCRACSMLALSVYLRGPSVPSETSAPCPGKMGAVPKPSGPNSSVPCVLPWAPLGLPAALSWLVAAWLQNSWLAQLGGRGFNPPSMLPPAASCKQSGARCGTRRADRIADGDMAMVCLILLGRALGFLSDCDVWWWAQRVLVLLV